jgi:hypothetical protein
MTTTGHKGVTNAIVEQINKRHTTTVESRETERVPADIIARIEALEDRPVALQPVNDQQVIPRAIGDLTVMVEGFQGSLSDVVLRIDRLEQSPPTEPAELQEEINVLGKELAEMSGAVLTHVSALLRRVQALEQRFADLPVELAQLQAERRKA